MAAKPSIKHTRDTAANWTSNNPTLPAGQLGVETDTRKIKVGDGVTAWTSLPYAGDPTRGVQIQVVAQADDVTTSAVEYFNIPSFLDGRSLVRAQAYVDTAGTTNPTTVQIRNLTKYASNDALSTAISIASGQTTGTPGTVNASYDDVSTDDRLRISVTGQSTTPAKGLRVSLEFR